MSEPLPFVGADIEVLWSASSAWWRRGTVVAWNADEKRHEVSYHDEPEEEPVYERFWGSGSVARYRLTGILWSADIFLNL